MALEKNWITAKQGKVVEAANAYISAQEISVTLRGKPVVVDGKQTLEVAWILTCMVMVHTSRAAKYSDAAPLEAIPISIPYSPETDKNIHQFIYSWLVGNVDVFQDAREV